MKVQGRKVNVFEGARGRTPFWTAFGRGFCDALALSRALIVAPVRAVRKVLSDFVTRS